MDRHILGRTWTGTYWEGPATNPPSTLKASAIALPHAPTAPTTGLRSRHALLPRLFPLRPARLPVRRRSREWQKLRTPPRLDRRPPPRALVPLQHSPLCL